MIRLSLSNYLAYTNEFDLLCLENHLKGALKMAKTTDKVKAVVKALAVKSVQFACGTASTNHFCQTKEPKSVNIYFKKRK